MITAYSDASLNEQTGEAGLGVWLDGQRHTQRRALSDTQQAELLAAQFALQLTPNGGRVRLHLDNQRVAQDLQRALHGQRTQFPESVQILRAAQARGVQVQVKLIKRTLNRAHNTARAACRGEVFAEPPDPQTLRVRLRLTRGHLSVRWRGFQVHLPRGSLVHPPFLHGLLTAAEHLPPGTTGLLRQVPPYARHLWHTPGDAPQPLQQRLRQVQTELQRRGSRLRFAEGDRT